MQKENEEQIPDVEKEGWKAEKIIKEGANEEADEVVRKIEQDQADENDPDQIERVRSAPNKEADHKIVKSNDRYKNK